MYQTVVMVAVKRRAHRRPGLHHAIGNAAGEIVLKERPALPHHVPMRLPADQPGERRGDGLVGDEVARQGHRRAHDQDDDRHAEQPRPAFGQEAIGRRLGHHGDDAAHEPRHRAVGQRDEQFDHEQRREQPLRLAGKVPQERNEPAPAARGSPGAAVGVRNRSKSANICGWLQALYVGSVNRPCQERPANRHRAALRHDSIFLTF